MVRVGGTRPGTECALVVPDDDGACSMRNGLVASAWSPPPPPKDAAVVMNVALLGLVVALGGESWCAVALPPLAWVVMVAPDTTLDCARCKGGGIRLPTEMLRAE